MTALGLNRVKQWFPPKEFFIAFFIGNALSHPFLWFVLPKVMPNYTTHLISGEIFVYIFEASTYYLLVRKMPFRRAIVISSLQNSVSLALGLMIQGFNL